MAILTSADGKFYEIPEKDLSKFEVPPEKVKELMGSMGGQGGPGPGAGPGGAGMGGPGPAGMGGPGPGAGMGGQGPGMGGQGPGMGGPGGVNPYGFRIRFGGCWNNCWRNWQNCSWRNCY